MESTSSIESQKMTCASEQQPPSSKLASSASYLTDLCCDDTLLRILSYADLSSLICFTRGTCQSLRHRFDPTKEFHCQRDIWRDAFIGHNFAPVDKPPSAVAAQATLSLAQDHGEQQPLNRIDYFNAIRQRLSLWSTLSGSARQKKCISTKQCFSLPTRMFYFVPLVPPDMMHYPPEVEGGGNDISFSFTDDGLDDEEGDNGEDHDDEFREIDMEPNNREGEADLMNNNNNGIGVGHFRGTMEFDDPPPVEFACDSFSFTSSGTGTEFVLLNPFSGSVEVYDSILDNAILGDETLLEQAMMDASEGIVRKRVRVGSRRPSSILDEEDNLIPDDENSEIIAGEAIHNRIKLHHKMYDTPPKQVLFSVDDYFDLDINEIFGQHTPFAKSGRREGGSITVDWVGVDSHAALCQDNKSVAGNTIGAARILTMESGNGHDEELACTEVFAWSTFENDMDCDCILGKVKYASKYVCRAAGAFYFLDICATYQKLYAAFQAGCCPFEEHHESRRGDGGGDRTMRQQLMDIEDESMVNDDGGPIRMSKAIFCLPLVSYSGEPSPCPETIASYFPSPDACIVAQYPVSSFSVDPTGNTLVVGTIYGTIEIWQTCLDQQTSSSRENPRRLHILSVRESFMKRHRSMTMDEQHPTTTEAEIGADDKPTSIEIDDNATETQDDLALLENHSELVFPHKHPGSKVSQIYLPRHMPVHQCGFVTKQRSQEHGNTLLLWQTNHMSSDKREGANERFHISAMINLPISAQCHPEVHFDGRRLIVFGKDQIGLILLVYHVLGTRFDQDEFDESKLPTRSSLKSKKRRNKMNEESGGVVHIEGERRIKFVNRIRHAGLGGLEYYDSMLLSANERFLVVNTKTGNLVGSDGSRNASEGLLVIDLQEYGCY